MTNRKLPPLMQYIMDVQKKHSDSIVCSEIGNFFEIHEIDGLGYAKEASQILDIVLTRRDKSDPSSPYMCGFPSFSAENHFKKLVAAGKTVVVLSQSIKGKKSDQNKGVKREITQILSPGTMVENISKEKQNYFSCVYFEENICGICLIDVSTGEVIVTELEASETQDFLDIKDPSEILICGNFNLKKKERQLLHRNDEFMLKKMSSAGTILSEIYSISNPTSNPEHSAVSLGLSFYRLGTLALANLFNYLTEYNSLLLKKVSKPKIYTKNEHLYIPKGAFSSLEVFKSQNEKEIQSGTLVGILDRCKTAMGQRKLREWLHSPLTNIRLIDERHEKIKAFLSSNYFAEELKEVYDFSRLSRKMAIKRLMPHEIFQLEKSIRACINPLTKTDNKKEKNEALKILDFLNKNINISISEGMSDFSHNFFNQYLTEDVREAFNLWENNNKKLLEIKTKLEAQLDAPGKLRIIEKSESINLIGPKSLSQKAKEKQISYVLKASDVQFLGEDWTLTSKDFITYKYKFLYLSQELWEKFQLEFIERFGQTLLAIGEKIAELDVLSCFAKISLERNYTKPVFLEKETAFLNLKLLRHPVVELSKSLTEGYVANTVELGESHKTMVIYGANSAGKSTILKALALNILMAQIGCYIAAEEGSSLSIFESILTRMSSLDNISDGYSTFTLEMTELQHALTHREKRCIFLFDEIGRGTSVEDGEALAYGTLAYLDEYKNRSITLFATHYHSLVTKIKDFSSIVIKNVSCYSGSDGKLVFSRLLEPGPGSGSYGIDVAQSCGLPIEIINLAKRYNLNVNKLKTSNYNAIIEGISCELCKQNPAQQTHHISEQKQGKVKSYIDESGQKKNINDKSNLVLLCATCHEQITRGKIRVKKKRKSIDGSFEFEIEKLN